MARASTVTLLSLDRFAKIMGLPPASFNSAFGRKTSNAVVFPVAGCSTVWFQHPWQNQDQLSREELAETIRQCESDLAETLGYWPGPVWIEQEVHKQPLYFRPDAIRVGNIDAHGQVVGLRANYGKIIAAGRRTATLVDDNVAVAYSDADADTFSETATITGATTVTDARELQFFFAGHSGEPEWEIRPARSCVITGGVYTATFWTWQLVDPDLWETLPDDQDNIAAIDVTSGNRETVVDVYQVYNDTTATSATFYWEPDPSVAWTRSYCGGAGCTACTLTTQDGCLHVRDAMLGIVVPQPGDYDSTNDEWDGAAYTVCRDPDMVKIWYYCGELSQDWLKEKNAAEPLSDRWARAIAYMATARLERPICNCGNAMGLFEDLRRDLAYAKDGPHQVSFDVLDNPFGTRKGEVIAWRMVKGNARDKISMGGAVG